MKTIFFLAVSFIAFTQNSFATCPNGPHNDHLTLPQVMVNFGLFVGPADDVAIRSQNPNETITDEQINAGIKGLASAVECVSAVLANPTGDLLPDDADKVTGAARDDYINDFLYFMGEFKDELGTYSATLSQLLTEKAGTRNFQPVYQESQNLEDLVDHAHRKLSI